MSTNYIDQITDSASTPVTHDIQEATDIRIFRATCSTAAGTAAKVATLQDSKNYTLAAGVRVAVTFTYGNSAATPTLNVNSGGAKNIVVPTAVATVSSGNGTTYNTWGPYETIIFTYNGSSWVQNGSAYSIYNAYALANSKTANTGTVTSIATSGGLTGGTITTSGTISHSNAVAAQTTQAVYPIKIDAQGHISAYGGAVSIPSKTSDLTNDSGFITTDSDEKLAVEEATSNIVYYIIMGSGTSAQKRKYDSTGFNYGTIPGTTSAEGTSTLEIGNSTKTGTANNKTGQIRLYGAGDFAALLKFGGTGSGTTKTITLPDATGFVALGTGTSNYLAKWNGTNTLTTGPQIGSGTTKFLREDGTWQTPSYLTIGTTSSTAAAGNHTHSDYVPLSSTSVEVKSDSFRLRNNQSSATAQAGTNPYVTSLLIGDGREVTIDEYGDGFLAIHGKNGIFLHPQSSAIEVYSATKTYSVGNIVWYNRAYYKCTTAITTAEEWTSGHWINITTSSGTIKVMGNVDPVTTESYNLGNSTFKWYSLYTNNINGTTVPSITAQTTQAVYPITINAIGQIISYGTAITIPKDEKIKLTSVTGSNEYPLILGPTSITSGDTYSANYNTSVTLNASSQSLKLKAIRMYYDDNCMATLQLNGYNGTSTNNTPRLLFQSSKANSSGGSDYNVILKGLTTPSGNSDDDAAATKGYVNAAISSAAQIQIVRW